MRRAGRRNQPNAQPPGPSACPHEPHGLGAAAAELLQLYVLESFLRSRGNLRDMERELGISYPTVRARVEALVRALGFGPRDEAEAAPATPAPATPEEITAARREILERLANHELSAEGRAEAIRALGRNVR